MNQMMEQRNRKLFSPYAQGAELEPGQFPELYNISAAFTFQFLPYPINPKSPEFVYLDHDPLREEAPRDWEGIGNIIQWNTAWESAELRYQVFHRRLPKRWKWLKKFSNHNVYLLPGGNRYSYGAYRPLYHLLPRQTLERFGMPLLKKGIWPYTITDWYPEAPIQADFRTRLSNAFAHHIWPLIDSGSKQSAFSDTDSLRLLAHNLDFWLPYAYKVAEQRLRTFKRIACESKKQAKLLQKVQSRMPPGAIADRPRQGGVIWMGEEDAWAASKELIQAADGKGSLRGIIDAIRSNRVEDDFSNRWSYAREIRRSPVFHAVVN